MKLIRETVAYHREVSESSKVFHVEFPSWIAGTECWLLVRFPTSRGQRARSRETPSAVDSHSAVCSVQVSVWRGLCVWSLSVQVSLCRGLALCAARPVRPVRVYKLRPYFVWPNQLKFSLIAATILSAATIRQCAKSVAEQLARRAQMLL